MTTSIVRARKPTLTLPKKLAYATLGYAAVAALACTTGMTSEPAVDASTNDAALRDAAPDGCIYMLCNGSDASAACPGVVCLVPPAECPSGCAPFV